MKTNQIIDIIGNTPLVKANHLIKNENITLLLKLEGHNPGGSVKDRAAYNMIQSAIDRKEINKDTKLIEATSGNTGIALAMIASAYGLDMELVMPENSTKERIQTMEAYGAEGDLNTHLTQVLKVPEIMQKRKCLRKAILCSINFRTTTTGKHITKPQVPRFGEIPRGWSHILYRQWERLEPSWEPLPI